MTDGREAAPTRRRVLIAEDEALIRLDLREMLIEEGYDVVGEAGDGEAALRLAEQLRPDLVILDIKMPIMDGLTAAENIANSRLAPVVILTAFSQRDLVERARAAGFHSLIGGASADQTASIALQKALGFQKIAHLKEVGYKFGRWLDVVYLQLMLHSDRGS